MEAIEKTAFQDDTFVDRLEKLEAQSKGNVRAKPVHDDSPRRLHAIEGGREGETEVSKPASEHHADALPAAGTSTRLPAAGVTSSNPSAAAVMQTEPSQAIGSTQPTAGTTTQNEGAAQSLGSTHPAAGTTAPIDPTALSPGVNAPAAIPFEHADRPSPPMSGTVSSASPSTEQPSAPIDPPSHTIAGAALFTTAAAAPAAPLTDKLVRVSQPSAAAAETPTIPLAKLSAAGDEIPEEPLSPPPAPAKNVRSRGRTPNAGMPSTGPRTRSRASTPQATSSHVISAASKTIPTAQVAKSSAAKSSAGGAGMLSMPLDSVTEEMSGEGDMDLEKSDAEDAIGIVTQG